MEQTMIDPSQVNGWGIDADPKNDPTYPVKRHVTGEHAGYTWERPSQQPITVEILQSNERPVITTVFGTSTPPSGLSGMLRRAAFQYSESDYRHWVPLVLADQVGMVEGVLVDLSRGHIPNVFGEMGLAAEWKYNRKSLVTKVVVGTIVASAIVSYLRGRKKIS